MNNFSLLSLFTGGDVMVAGASILLAGASIASWGVIIGKLRLWARARRGLNPNLSADKIIEPFDRNLWFLSLCQTVAPFVGLFGTVWGVMKSFASIGAAKSVSVAVIAPGLAAALGTTVLGLLVAIPAAVFYQYFANKSDNLYNRLANGK